MAKSPKYTLRAFKLSILRRHSKNGWKAHTSLVFSKTNISKEEIIWLETFVPDVKFEIKFVEHYKHMPAYKLGMWDGKATFVTFGDRQDALLFKLHWWNFPD
jgi:hypothetical protein